MSKNEKRKAVYESAVNCLMNGGIGFAPFNTYDLKPDEVIEIWRQAVKDTESLPLDYEF